MKILFAGTPDFAVLPFENIINSGFEVVGVVTQIDKPQGRKGILTPPPVKVTAEKYNIPVFQPVKIKEEISALQSFNADILITCAYGQILTQEVLDLFPMGVWNIHAGLLPFYRGASPIQSCILNGEKETGVCVMKTELGLDSGDILCVEKTAITPTETYGELSNRLSQIGANLIVNALKVLQSGNYTLTKQGETGVNIVRKIGKEQAKVSFDNPCESIVNLVRAMNPSPIAYAEINGEKLNIYLAERVDFDGAGQIGEVVCDIPKKGLIVRAKDGFVKLLEVQASGGKRLKGGDFLNGRKVKKGDIFSC
jgi:methionyl-tRNA formyltransferase